MRAAAWFVAGAVTGSAYVLILWWTVSGLRTGSSPQTPLLVLGSALLRAVLVAAVLALAMVEAITSGLLAFAGFLLARMAGSVLVASRMTDGGRALRRGS